MKFFDLEMSGLAGGGDDRGVSYSNAHGIIFPRCEVTTYTNGTGFFSCLRNKQEGVRMMRFRTNANQICEGANR